MQELIRQAKEVYNLTGEVYIFENGNIFSDKRFALDYSKESGLNYLHYDLSNDKEVSTKTEDKPKSKK